MKTKPLSYAARQERIANLWAELQAATLRPIIADVTAKYIQPVVGKVSPALQTAIDGAILDSIAAYNKAMQESSLRIYSPQS